MSGFGGFSAAFSTGERPVWDSPIFRDLVLGNSLAGGAAAANKKPAEKAGVKQLSDSLGLLTAQLYVLSNSSTLAPALKPVVGRVHAAFSRSMDTCRAIPQVSDQASFFEVLSSFVAKVRAMQPGSVLVVPGGWKGGLVCYVLHCESFESFNLAVCSTQDGLQYHPMRIDPATGELQFNAPFLLRGIPAHRVRDGAIWCMLLRAVAFPKEAASTAALVYEHLLPFLNARPLGSNLTAAEVAERATARLGHGIEIGWLTPKADGEDVHAHQLATMAAVVALQLSADANGGAAAAAGGGSAMAAAISGAMGGAGGLGGFGAGGGGGGFGEGMPMYSAHGLSLLLRHQLVVLSHTDLLRVCHGHEANVTASTLELLSRASRRLSACTPTLAAGAATLAPSELQAMQADLGKLQAAVDAAKGTVTNERAPLPPPDGAELRGSASHPLFERLCGLPSVEALAGEGREPPVVLPVRLSCVPDEVTSLRGVSNALQHCVHACTVLSNQRGLVQNSYALRVTLLTHLFLRVLPVPLPLRHAERGARCFWAKAAADATHDTQAEILRWLSLLTRHFAAASLSVPLTASFDAVRMLTFAAMAAVADAVLRMVACDAPSALSLHYSGMADGPGEPFAIELRHFERESERCQLLQPHLAAARTLLLDYFRDMAEATPPERILFRFERSLELGKGEATLLGQLCCELGYPHEEVQLGAYLAAGEGQGAGLIDLYPELGTFRDIVFYLKAMMVPSSDALPELRAWAPEDAKLQWSWARGKEDGGSWRFGIRAFGGPLTCAAWMSGDDDGANATAKPGFFTRLLGKKAAPRLPPSAANPSTVAGQDILTEDDVLHVRHLPDFGGTLRAADAELLLSYLLAPYLRVPLLMRFFAQPAHTQALAQPELQEVLDAALF